MKKIRLLIFMLFCLFPMGVFADQIYRIDMDIDIDKNGNALITEKWDVLADSGSEWYKQLYNLGNSEVSNFKVLMDGKELSYNNHWNVNGSMNDKKNSYGINYVSEGLELCFGKTDYERHTFTLTYNLSNAIINTDDSQLFYMTIMPNVSAKYFDATIRSYYEFPDTLDVWGYGYKGYAYVANGVVKSVVEEGLNNDYVALLVKFPSRTFNTDNRVAGYDNFNQVYNMAEEGTFEYDYGYPQEVSKFQRIINVLSALIPFIFIGGISTLIIVLNSRNGYGYKDNKKIDKKNTNMFREIPCNKDIYYANALIKLNNFGYKESNIFGAIILKWVKNNKIIFKNGTSGIFNKETSMIDLTLNPTFDNDFEQRLFNMMYDASGDGILETKELEKWCRKNYDKFFKYFESLEDDTILKLKKDGHIYKRKDKSECSKKNVMDDMIYNDSLELYGLKLYLEEFSRMNTKEVMDVKLWDEYLMFAYLFGNADKVAKQLKDLYPQVLENPNMNIDYNTLVYVNNLSTKTVHAASAARSAAESYSAGGGGFSSGGGGGGSFGGGGSAGGR